MKANEKAKLLKELGMTAIADDLLKKKRGREKLLKAVELFRYATGEDIDDYNTELKTHGKRLEIVEIKDYKTTSMGQQERYTCNNTKFTKFCLQP